MGILNALFGWRDDYDIEKIKAGFTKNQVLAEFGKPCSISKGTDIDECWLFTIPFSVFVTITFGDDGKVSRTYSSRS